MHDEMWLREATIECLRQSNTYCKEELRHKPRLGNHHNHEEPNIKGCRAQNNANMPFQEKNVECFQFSLFPLQNHERKRTSVKQK